MHFHCFSPLLVLCTARERNWTERSRAIDHCPHPQTLASLRLPSMLFMAENIKLRSLTFTLNSTFTNTTVNHPGRFLEDNLPTYILSQKLLQSFTSCCRPMQGIAYSKTQSILVKACKQQ